MFIEEFGYIFPMSYFLGLFTMLVAYSSAIFKTTMPSFLNEVVSRIFIVIAVSLYYLKLISFETVIVLYVFSYLFLILVILYYFKVTDTLNFRINWKIFKTFPSAEALKFTLFMSVTTLASMSLRNIDAVFIGSYLNLADVAVYTIALTIGAMIDVPSVALSKIVIPKLADAFKSNNQVFIKDVYYKSNRVCLITGAFLFVLVFVNAFDILNLLPKKYVEGEWVLKIIAIGGLINTATGFNLNLIAFSHKYYIGTLFLTSLALLSAFSNVLLIPIFGLIGAAVGTAFSLVAVNFIAVLYIKKRFQLQPFEKADILILLLAILIGTGDLFFPKFENSLISIIVKSGIVTLLFGAIVLKMNVVKNFKSLGR
jgi:O-antigen/teichoic acid export membrane protein